VNTDKILVTGSEGLIGTELSRKLRSRGFLVEGFDIKHDQDVNDFDLVIDTIKRVNGVIHLAAFSRVVEGFKNPIQAVQTNIGGTVNILEAIRKVNPSCWMVFGSSREVYGEVGEMVNENFPKNPENVYGATKVAGELLTLNYGTNYNLRTFVIRFSNIYGGINDHQDRLIPQFVKQAITNSEFTLNGGNQKFDFVHLNDATEGLLILIEKILKNKELKNNTFHFVTGRGTSIKELIQIIIKISGSNSSIKYLPARKYDVETFVGDPSYTQKVLGWKPEISIEDGLKMYIDLFSK